jgi:predicted O-methyltransferase YrrM
MDIAVEKVLHEYHARGKDEAKIMRELGLEELERRLDEFLLSVGPYSGQLLNLLAKEMRARTIVEVGTSYGYSTLWLADAARKTDGRVITFDLHAAKQDYAREAIRKAGLADVVDFQLGDARETLAAFDGTIDFVLLDLWKDLYIPSFDLLYPKLNPGAVVVEDNMLFPEHTLKEALEYRRHVRAMPNIESVLLQVGSGLEVSRYARSLEIP